MISVKQYVIDNRPSSTDNAAIQDVIDNVLPVSGGTIYFPDLNDQAETSYRIDCLNPIRITKSNVTLLFAEGAILEATSMGSSWKKAKAPKPESAIIFAKGVCNLKIIGPGVLRGDRELREIPIGSGEIVRQGGDVVILAIGATVAPAVEAAGKLASGGIEATVVNARFAKPLDSELIIGLAKYTRRLVTVEENALSGGFGSSVAMLIQDSGIGLRML